jgi:hypothetical protein
MLLTKKNEAVPVVQITSKLPSGIHETDLLTRLLLRLTLTLRERSLLKLRFENQRDGSESLANPCAEQRRLNPR